MRSWRRPPCQWEDSRHRRHPDRTPGAARCAPASRDPPGLPRGQHHLGAPGRSPRHPGAIALQGRRSTGLLTLVRWSWSVRSVPTIPGRGHSWNGMGGASGFSTCHALSPAAGGSQPGGLTQLGGIPAVGTTEGVLVLEVVRPAGRQAISGEAFLRGAPAFADSHLSPGVDLRGRTASPAPHVAPTARCFRVQARFPALCKDTNVGSEIGHVPARSGCGGWADLSPSESGGAGSCNPDAACITPSVDGRWLDDPTPVWDDRSRPDQRRMGADR